MFEGETFSFNQTDGLGSRVANDLQAQPGHRAGDTVALLMDHEPGWLWLDWALQWLSSTTTSAARLC